MDYEKVKDYLLTVQATDRGIPPLSNQATVNVTVTDCNDNVPVFSQMAYTASVLEDKPVGEIVLKVCLRIITMLFVHLLYNVKYIKKYFLFICRFLQTI